MPIDIFMPALSPTMEEGALAKWHIKEGDLITSGDLIAEVETDKAIMEIEAVDGGLVAKLLVSEGTGGIKVNTPIATILNEDENVSDINIEAVSTPPTDDTSPAPTLSQSLQASVEPLPTPRQPSKSSHVPSLDPEISSDIKMVRTTVHDALRDAMSEEMRRDADVFVMGEEVGEYQGAYKVTQGLLDEFGPDRIIDTPITEHGFTGVGIGAAFSGLKPIVEFMTFNFALQAMDHLINSAAKTRYMAGGQLSCPIVFRGPNGAAARVGAQHSQDFSAWYAHIPGLKVIAPWSASDAKGLLKAAIRDPNPVIFLENEVLYGLSFDVPMIDDHVLPIGKAKTVRTGNDVTIISFSHAMEYALAAAEALECEGINAEVIDLRTLRPLDTDTIIASIKKTNRCVVVEQGWPQCGIGSEISALLMSEAFDWLDAAVMRVTGKDVPMPYAANLEALALPSTDDVVAAVKAVTYS